MRLAVFMQFSMLLSYHVQLGTSSHKWTSGFSKQEDGQTLQRPVLPAVCGSPFNLEIVRHIVSGHYFRTGCPHHRTLPAHTVHPLSVLPRLGRTYAMYSTACR